VNFDEHLSKRDPSKVQKRSHTKSSVPDSAVWNEVEKSSQSFRLLHVLDPRLRHPGI